MSQGPRGLRLQASHLTLLSEGEVEGGNRRSGLNSVKEEGAVVSLFFFFS